MIERNIKRLFLKLLSPDSEKERQKLYLTYRDKRIKGKDAGQNLYDKYILVISSGALGLSIAFIKDIPFLTHHNNNLIMYSWFLLGISSMLTLFSFKTSNLAYAREVKYIDDLFQGLNTKEPKFFKYLTITLNIVSTLCFVSGIILNSIYIKCNLINNN